MKKLIIFSSLLLIFFSCKENQESDLTINSIIPKPETIQATGDYFVLSKKTNIEVDVDNSELLSIREKLLKELSFMQKQNVEESSFRFRKQSNKIILSIKDEVDVNPEAYKIEIGKKEVNISSTSTEGLFRGVQSFIQLAVLSGSDAIRDEKFIALPTGSIKDSPQYNYRTSMLDVSRHFFKPEDVKRYIDLLSMYKINHLHLHLSDDQGWRIEIKSWPKLTEIGGSTEVGGGEGGFYTQEEFKGIVKYAAERYITIVPEIDMPGHTNAALAAYPELNCDGKSRELYTGTRVGFSTLCTDNEITYQFVDDVVREISEMTPGPYFHVGGDESHVTELPDYIYFINRVKKIVNDHDKIMIGWDEVSHAALDEEDIAQYWASAENAQRAIEKGARLILSPAKFCYLDMKYDSLTQLGLNWAAYIDVKDAYNWKPLELLEGIVKEDILGIESPLWGETIETMDDIEYLAFPRIIGHAEIGWTDSDSLDWDDYSRRLNDHKKFLEIMEVNSYNWEE